MSEKLDKIFESIPREKAEILKTSVTRGYESFSKMCPDSQEPVLSILRVHLLTEYNIERAFHALLPRADKIANVSFSYAQKLESWPHSFEQYPAFFKWILC